MLLSRKANNFINRIHERSIWIVSDNNESNFEHLVEKKEIIIYQKNLQVPVTEVYEIINACAPTIMVTFLYLEKIHPR